MATFEIKVEGTAYETYEVDAETEADARAMWRRGEVLDPIASEVESAEVVSVTDVSESGDDGVVRMPKPKRPRA